MKRVLPFVLWLLFGGSACESPAAAVSVSRKPGWGLVHSREEERMTVRAVPAAAVPSKPVTRTGKPGWGRNRLPSRRL